MTGQAQATSVLSVIPAEDWGEFEAWIKRPAKVIPALVELARRKLVWNDN